jgi:hypothetical protein
MKWIVVAIAALIALVVVIIGIGALLPQNHSAMRSARFKKPPQVVWDVITGPPDWRKDVRSFQQLSPRDGRRTWKEIDQHGGAVTYEALEETPPMRLVTRIADRNLPYGGTWIHEIAPDPDDPEACVLTITEKGEIYNPVFRFMSRFVFSYSGTIDAFLKALDARLGQGSD